MVKGWFQITRIPTKQDKDLKICAKEKSSSTNLIKPSLRLEGDTHKYKTRP